MTHKELLVKDLCARLPYNTMVEGLTKPEVLNTKNLTVIMTMPGDPYLPYLRSMSSMTEKEAQREAWLREYGSPEDYIDFCLSHHLDYRRSYMGNSMIEAGLALEAPKDMYNIK